MVKQKVKRLVYPLVGVFFVTTLLIYGQLFSPTSTSALVPATDVSTYTWGGNDFHDIEANFKLIVNPLNTSDDFYSWPLEFSFNGSAAQIGFQVCYYTSSNPCNGTTGNDGNSIRFLYRVYGAVNCSGSGCAGNSSYYQITSTYTSFSVGSTYSLKVQQDGGVSYDGKSYAKWGGYVNGSAIGEIYVPTTWSIANSASVQTQYLGPQLSSCGSTITHSDVQFTDIYMDEDTSKISPSSPSNSGPSTTCQYSYINTISGGVEQFAGYSPPKTPPPSSNPPGNGSGSSGGSSGGGSNGGGNPNPGSNGGSNSIIIGSSSQATINSTSNGSSNANILHFSTSTTGSGSSGSSSTSSLTTIKAKKKHSSTLATAASITGIFILILLGGWGGYLLYMRLSKRKSFTTSPKVDTDLYFDKTIKPQSTKKSGLHSKKSKSTSAVISKDKLSKEQLIAFGQEALLLNDLKEEDKDKKS